VEGPYKIYETFLKFNIRVGFAVLGGFLSGHGELCTATAMRYLHPGLTLALVNIMSLVFMCVFNYVQVGAKRPDYVFCGIGFALIAIVLLSQTVQKSSKKELKIYMRLEAYQFFSENPEWLIQKKLNGLDPEGPAGSLMPASKTENFGPDYQTFSNETYKTNPQPQLTMSKRKGLVIVSIAGLLSACWGPMSTYARNGSYDELVRSPGVMLFFFSLGELIALPDIYLICRCIEPQPEYTLTERRLFWGIINGVVASSGYFFYFTSTYHNMGDIVVPACVIVQCNSLVAVITDIIRGEFNGASAKTKILLTTAITCYCNAALMNACSI